MLTRYEPGIQSDLLLGEWWQRMATCDDLERGFSVELTALGAFMGAMRACGLVYMTDEGGIWFAAWFEPKLSGAFYGLWVRADKRHSRDALAAILDSIEYGLSHFRVLIMASLHESVVNQAVSLGFVSMGVIPYLFDHQPTHVAWIDEDHFDATRDRFQPLADRLEHVNG